MAAADDHQAFSVALVAPGQTAHAFAGPLERALLALGASVIPCADGDPALLSADGVILLGYFPRLPLTAALLAGRQGGHRPAVVTWCVEPLVPNDVTRWGMAYARRLHRWSGGWHNKSAQRLIRALYWPLAAFGMGRWSAASSTKELQFAFTYTLWLRGALDAGWIDAVAASTGEKAQTVRGWGGEAVFAPLSVDWTGKPLDPSDAPRDIDVLFLGRMSNLRRSLALLRITRRLRRAGLNLRTVVHGLRGEARDAVLARTRVILHLTKYPWDTAWMRFYMGANHGVAVASEPLSLPGPLRPGQDYLSAPVRDLPDRIIALLADEEARRSMVFSCRARIAETMTFEAGAQRMLTALQTHAKRPERQGNGQ